MRFEWPTNIRDKGNYFFNLIGTARIRRNILQAIPFWVASVITGLIAVGYTRLFGLSEHVLQYALGVNRRLLFVASPVLFFLGYLVVQRFAPNARGSGIPQVMAAIELATPKNDSYIKKLLSLRIIVVKIFSSLLMVMGGGAIGREGPTIQIAGSVFRLVNKWIPRSWPKLSEQSFILTGAAAGLAAAFNTPLGGVVFAMEELAKIHIRFFRTALFSAVIIAGLTAQGLLGPYLYLGYPDVLNLKFSMFFTVALTAVLAGLLGSLMCRIILYMAKLKRNFNKSRTILFPLAAGLAVALIAYFINADILGSGKEVMNRTLFTSHKYVGWGTVLARTLGPILCFNTGAAGGVFAPALAAGASVGAFLSNLFSLTGSSANILILSGMVGFLTGVSRTPFTSAILVLEMTDRHNVIFHLMLAALLSNLAAMLVDKHSFYERLKESYMPHHNNDTTTSPVTPAPLSTQSSTVM